MTGQYRVSGNKDQIELDTNLKVMTWSLLDDKPHPDNTTLERLRLNRVFVSFDDIQMAKEVYGYMRRKGLVALKNWT